MYNTIYCVLSSSTSGGQLSVNVYSTIVRKTINAIYVVTVTYITVATLAILWYMCLIHVLVCIVILAYLCCVGVHYEDLLTHAIVDESTLSVIL